jgi:hypothetical protein
MQFRFLNNKSNILNLEDLLERMLEINTKNLMVEIMVDLESNSRKKKAM